MSNKKGKIIIIVAPSGAGKSTLITRLKKEYPELEESISCTTREMRDGEVDGVQYFFSEKDDFEQKIKESEFLEWAQVHNNYYGTSKKFVEGRVNNGQNLIFDIDVQGTDSFKQHFGDEAKAIFIAPPSLEVLEKRLRGRGTDKEDVIEVRLNNAKSELQRKDDYDFCIVNDDFELAYQKLSDVISEILEG